jgi:hypothetical protein
MMVNLFLDRIFCKPTHTVGVLSIGERRFCDTLEDPVRDFNKDGDLEDAGEMKIYGETAIPYGRYPVVVTMSPKFKRELPLILDVKHFIGIRMHRGRFISNTSGCVLVGDNTKKAQLTNGEYYEKKLTAMLKAYIYAGEKIYINVV